MMIEQVFVRYNTLLPSLSSVERLFSFATLTNAPKFCSLTDQMFEERVLLIARTNFCRDNTH